MSLSISKLNHYVKFKYVKLKNTKVVMEMFNLLFKLCQKGINLCYTTYEKELEKEREIEEILFRENVKKYFDSVQKSSYEPSNGIKFIPEDSKKRVMN